MSPPRLGKALLPALQGLDLPRYDRSTLQPGLLHIGVGAFHRAHQAEYTDDVLNGAGGPWGIVGASLRSATAERQLAPQDGLYTVNALGRDTSRTRVIGAITHVLTAATAPGYDELMSVMADPAIRAITLTVTEKGYCHAAGTLDETHADVRHDLRTAGVRRSLPGVLAAGLDARRRAGGAPITLISCDNLSGNGQVLRNVLTAYAQLRNPALASWIENSVAFPATMVDRIVPGATEDDRVALSRDHGFRDEATVTCEPFRQWVIEDRFAAERPPWEDAGALLVDEVLPYESAKLRLLNGPHSAGAYLGLLRGHEFVHEVMQDAPLRQFLSALVEEELLPGIPALPALDLPRYVASIFERFANPAIAYGTRQVGTDGSQKLPQRLIPVLRERLETGAPVTRLALVVAAWIQHLEAPAPDPLASTLQSLYRKHNEAEALVNALFSGTRVFETLETVRPAAISAISAALTRLRTHSLNAALAL